MCGRYAMELKSEELQSTLEAHGFEIKAVKNEAKTVRSLNISPQTFSLVYCNDPDSNEPVLTAMKWTLQPSYAKEPVSYPSFNTRSESLEPLKPAWRSAKTNRGIVFMQGYYEWQAGADPKEKLPFYMSNPEMPVLCCLVIWDMNPKLCDVPTYSIVTTVAAPNLRDIHERMPVIAPDYDLARFWVNGKWPDVLSALKPNPQLSNHRVAKTVNKVGVNQPGLNKPFKEAKVTDWFSPKKNATPSSKTQREMEDKKQTKKETNTETQRGAQKNSTKKSRTEADHSDNSKRTDHNSESKAKQDSTIEVSKGTKREFNIESYSESTGPGEDADINVSRRKRTRHSGESPKKVT